MEDKKGKPGKVKNAFSDLTIDDLGRYGERNAKAHKLKRAMDLDTRIREFAERKRTPEWVEEAPEFCAREELANKDIADASKEYYRLALIKNEAEKLKKLAEDEAKRLEDERLAQIKAESDARIAAMNAKAAEQAEAERIANEKRLASEKAAAEAKIIADQKAAALAKIEAEKKADAEIAAARAEAETAKLKRAQAAEEARLAAEEAERREAERLRKIQADAEASALAARLAAEAAAEKAARDAAAKKKEIADKAAAGDELIAMLKSSPRSKFWCDEVQKAKEEITAFPREAKILMKNYPAIEELAEEAKELLEAIIIDKRIDKLNDVAPNRRGSSWGEDVIACWSDARAIGIEKLKEKATLEKLLPLAKRAKYDTSIRAYEKMLRDISAMGATAVSESTCAEFDKLNGSIASLEYSLSDFIKNFDNSWDEAAKKVIASRAERTRKKQEADALAKQKAADDAKRAAEEAAAAKARADEEAKKKVADEYRLILVTIEGGDFDRVIDDFDALYKKRTSVGFSLSQRIDNFEVRMAAARKAVDKRKKAIQDEKDKAAREAEEAIKRQERLEAIKKNLALIISLSITVLLTAGCIVAGILLESAREWFISGAIFVLAGYFVSGFGPIVLKEFYHPGLSIGLKSACAVAGLVLTFIPATVNYGATLFGVIIIGSAVEYLLVAINDDFVHYGITDEFTNAMSIFGFLAGSALTFLNIGISTSSPFAVFGIGTAFLIANIYFMVGLTDGDSDFNWIIIGLEIAMGIAGFVLTFISRECALIGLFLGIVAVANFIATGIISTISYYEESHYVTCWVAMSITVVICLVSLLMYFKFWGKADYVVDDNGTLQGVFVHDGSNELRIPSQVPSQNLKDENGEPVMITVTSIGFDAMDRVSMKWRCNFKTIYLPETCKTLEAHSFSYCNIPTIVLNDGLETISNSAFYFAYTTKLGYPENIEKTPDMPDNYIPESVKTIEGGAFAYSSFTGSVKIPDGIKVAKGFANSKFSKIDISGVTEIPTGAFYDCYNLTEMVIPEGITALPDNCFRNCSSLSKVTLPSTLTELGAVSFGGCTSLHKLDCRYIKVVGKDCFKNSSKTFSPYFRDLKDLNDGAFFGITGGMKVYYKYSQSEWVTGVNKHGNYNIDNYSTQYKFEVDEAEYEAFAN